MTGNQIGRLIALSGTIYSLCSGHYISAVICLTLCMLIRGR